MSEDPGYGKAGYEGLLPVQQQWFDRLMSQKMSDWPEPLKRYLEDYFASRSFCGDALADAVGQWVKDQRD